MPHLLLLRVVLPEETAASQALKAAILASGKQVCVEHRACAGAWPAAGHTGAGLVCL
jgi:hypothetical protein